MSLIILLFLNSSSFGLSLKSKDIVLPKQIAKQSSQKIHSIFEELKKIHSDSTPTLWKLKFQKALLLKKKDLKTFCKNMTELSKIESFPLHQLALIYSYEVCPYPQTSLVFDHSSFPEWLKIRLAESFYKRGKKFKNSDYIFESAKYLGEYAPFKDLRIFYLKHALSLSKQKKEKEITATLKNLLYKEAPYLNPKPEFKDYLSIAHGYRKNRAFKKARSFYKKILNSDQAGFEEKNQSFKWLYWIYKNLKNHRSQITTSKQWSDWLLKENSTTSLKYYYDNELNLVRDYWNFNKNEKALKVLDKIMEDPQASVVADKAYWLRGLINEQEKNFEESLKDWDKSIRILVKEKNDKALLESILWKKAWLLRAQKKYKLSLQILHELKNSTLNPYTKYKILFWIGETYRDLKYNFLARQTFKHLIKEDVFGYYGLMAYYRLNNHLNIKVSKTDFKKYKNFINYKSENTVYWLLLFQESELLSRFLDLKKDNLLTNHKKTKENWINLFYLYTTSKKYLAIFQSLEKIKPKIKKYFLENHIDLLFPLDYTDEIEKNAKKREVPKPLIYALIRQESVFDSRARSVADAFGLMQIISPTARQTSMKMGLTYRGFRQLYNPARNILLGTVHLKSLLTQYQNSFIFTVAAYNAGATPVNKWKKYITYNSALEFIENIPYEETRTYVRLLIRNYIFYHNLLEYEDSKYPDWIFKLDHTSVVKNK